MVNMDKGHESHRSIHPSEQLDYNTMENSLLDNMSPQLEVPIKLRRESFADSTQNFHTSDGTWPGFQFSLEHSNLESSAPSQSFFNPPQTSTMGTPQNG